MENQIYPTCPECDNKASKGEGVSFHELPTVKWQCPNCGLIHSGEFWPEYIDVQWEDSREPTTLDRIKQTAHALLA